MAHISVLPNISNIYEKMIFDFQNKHSTNHALISLTELIQSALDNGQFACGIFINIQKACDAVAHKTRHSKMNME